MKPKITDVQCDELKELVFQQIPYWQKIMLSYGFGLTTLATAVVITALHLHPGSAIISAIFCAGCHFIVRDAVGHVPALAHLDQYDLRPISKEMQMAADEVRKMGHRLSDDDWPDIIKIGFVQSAVARIESLRSKCCSVAGYTTLLLVACILG